MSIKTVEQARMHFERNGGRVVRATLHEEGGNRQVWFVREFGWCFLASDEKLIALAREVPQQPLVSEIGDTAGVSWPINGSAS